MRAYTTRALVETDEAEPDRPSSTLRDELRFPPRILVIDSETEIDASQRLLFAAYRVINVAWAQGLPTLSVQEEGLLYADDLAKRDPDGYGVLTRYAATHVSAIDLDASAASVFLRLRSRREFFAQVWWPYAYQARAVVVFFNAPFDLSRLALHTAKAGPRRSKKDQTNLGRSAFEGGFSFSYWGRTGSDGRWHDHPARHRVLVKHIDSKRALKGFGAPAPKWANPEDLVIDDEGRSWFFLGHILDLRTLAFALTDKGHTLETACAGFGVSYTKRKVEHGRITREYITYCREDAEATAKLWAAAMTEYARHPIELQATKAYSPATIGKAYLRALGVTPPLRRLGASPEAATWDELLGYAMVGYFGGRAECRIRRIPVPVMPLDYTSMYPAVQTLMGLEAFLTAERIDAVEEDPNRLARWIAGLAPDALFDRVMWPHLTAICLVEPQAGDVLPIRARYGGATSPLGIGVNTWGESSSEPLWYTLPDVVASWVLTKRAPKIVRAIRFVPRARSAGIKRVRLRGEFETELDRGRFFASIVERRARIPQDERKRDLGLFLKVLANSASYGIFAEMVRNELAGKRKEALRVHGLRSFDVPTSTPETPGEFFFAPTAALVTGAARLMLALLEREVAGAGGCFAFADTDSMAVVASREGGELEIAGIGADGTEIPQRIRALSWDAVEAIVRRFDALNPYDPSLVPHLLKIEQENFDASGTQRELWCQAISAKRYCLHTLEGGRARIVSVSDASEDDAEGEAKDDREDAQVVKRSEHGLGHLLNPYDPEDQGQDWIREAWEWLLAADRSLPAEPPSWFDLPAVSRTSVSTPGSLKTFEGFNRGKPYAEQVKPFNFLLTCYPDPVYGKPDDAFRLVAPFERDPAKWIHLGWYEAHTGRPYRITTYGTGSEGVIRVRTYGEILEEYRTHPETKAAGPDGQACGKQTRGLLSRRLVRMEGRPQHVGKESNKLDERAREEVDGESDYLNIWEERSCACGCGTPVAPKRKYLDRAHRQRAYRNRH